jgi:hypothetical protein
MSWNKKSLPYQPSQTKPYLVSRSKIELLVQCRRCFWLDTRKSIKRPSGPPFQINKAIDELLKKEFDIYRKKSSPHPLMIEYKIDAVPFEHANLDDWRENFTGIQSLHKPTNLLIFGAVDDIWINSAGELIVVDYKATAKKSEVNLDADWQVSYKRQLEVYQWLLRQNGFKVSKTGYFVYANASTSVEGFYDKINFKTKVISYTGDDSWVDKTLLNLKNCLDNDIPPVGESIMGGQCEYCAYARSRTELTIEAIYKKNK